MDCKFKREGEKIVCERCGFYLITEADASQVHMMCREEKPPQYPSTFQTVKNAVGSLVNFALSGFKLSPEKEAERRLKICTGDGDTLKCEFYDEGQGRCTQCSCYMSFKTKLESEHCPVGKW